MSTYPLFFASSHLQKGQAFITPGITLSKVEIEDSEYPFLVGVICKKGDYDKLTTQIRKMDAYDYSGCIGSQTCNATNIVPYGAFPQESCRRISHRTMLRQQGFFDKLLALQ